jgi:plasmid stabilization system protein ParE
MSFRVVILRRADEVLERNAAWWAAQHSVDQAVRWLITVNQQIKRIADAPESYGLSLENEDFPYEIREKLVGSGAHPSYRAVFTVKGDAIYVLAVRRAAQDRLDPRDVDDLI